MCSAVKRPIRSAATNIGLKELMFRSGGLQGGYSCCAYLAVMVVGPVEFDDHVPLFLVVANAIYVVVPTYVCTRERVQ